MRGCAAAWVPPAPTARAWKPLMSDVSFGWALVGAGIMGQRMARQLGNEPALRLRSVWDPSPAAMSAWPAEMQAASLEAALEAPGVRWVYVASPPTAHLAAAQAARLRGLPVFCEKPLATSMPDIEAMSVLASHAPGSMAVNFPFAYSPVWPRLAQARDHLGQGEAMAVSIRLRMKAWPRPWQQGAHGWLSEPGLGGGYAREVLSHFLFLALRLGGTLGFTHWTSRHDPRGMETQISAQGSCGRSPLTVDTALAGEADDDNQLRLDWPGHAGSHAALVDWGDFVDGSGRCTPQHPEMAVAPALLAWLKGLPPHPTRGALATFEEAAQVARWIETLRAVR
ncbi:MAG: hypothetical protein E6Q92_10220 [Burkholderiaceae bacterium]|nr:MAG: hypothetical protein E6Q92_10220 [Burkholderiaceae bacterium]